jgi:hypothetical protein
LATFCEKISYPHPLIHLLRVFRKVKTLDSLEIMAVNKDCAFLGRYFGGHYTRRVKFL